VQVSVDKIGPCEAKVSFSVPREDFDREYSAALKSSGKEARMKGFRPGKVPTKVLEKEFGTQVRQQAIEHFMGKAYEQAVKDGDLKPVGHERVKIEDITLEDGADLEHIFSVSLKPEFELKEYKGLEVASELEPVLDDEIKEAIADLRLQQSTPGPVGDEGITEDGQALCKVKWESGGETLLERDGLRMAPLAAPPGVDPDKFKEGLIGAQAGDGLELELVVPDDFDQEEMRGKSGTCFITVTEGFSMVPPPDEDIWKMVGAESQEEFDKTARDRMELAKQNQENARQETVLLEGLLKKHDFDLPEQMISGQLDSRRDQLRQQLAQNGVPEDKHDEAVAEREEELQTVTEKGVRALFLVSAIAEKEELKVEESEMLAELQAIAQQHQAKYEDVVEHYRKNGLFQQMQIELMERKVRVFLRENAKTTEP
jgi:trigger factor